MKGASYDTMENGSIDAFTGAHTSVVGTFFRTRLFT